MCGGTHLISPGVDTSIDARRWEGEKTGDPRNQDKKITQPHNLASFRGVHYNLRKENGDTPRHVSAGGNGSVGERGRLPARRRRLVIVLKGKGKAVVLLPLGIKGFRDLWI